ncbi:MAG TPA: hypothetical protein VLD17_17875 [Gemmatimonadaceae bacterium]|jgi:hypothetical protein|nr:hypothetical protein [Gemmatimonadaceae bacterium]
MRARVVAFSLVLALAACATARGPHTGGGRDANLITAAEIENSHETDAYDAVRNLRPNMLVTHGQTTFNNSDPGIIVFLNGSQFGTVESLHRIAASDVDEIRFYSAGEASMRHGTGYPDGVIEVKTK